MTLNMDLELLWDDFSAALAKEVPLNAEARKKALSDAITSTDIDRLLDLNEKMGRVIDQITANDLSEWAAVLTPTQARALMVEELDQKEIKELLEIRRQMRRDVIFRHITETAGLAGESDPDFAGGEIAVADLKKRFVRQGGKPKFCVDEAKLAERLGDAAADQVFKTSVIPEQVVTKLDYDALSRLAQTDPSVMEILRDCVIQSGRTPLSLNVRDMK